MPPGLNRQHCANHPDRFGHALCMNCRKTVCQECATEWDGINYCVRCLAGRRRASGERSSVGGWILVGGFSTLLLYLAQQAMVWGTTFLFRAG